MLKLTITIEGKNTDDLEDALQEVRRKVAQEYTSGFDRNEDGNYSFNVTGQEETADVGS